MGYRLFKRHVAFANKHVVVVFVVIYSKTLAVPLKEWSLRPIDFGITFPQHIRSAKFNLVCSDDG